MTDPRATQDFEARFTGRVRGYTDPATARRVDALAMSRIAMSSARTTRRSPRWPGAGLLGRPFVEARLVAAFVAVVLIGVVSVGLFGRTSDSSIGLQPTPAISPSPSPAASASGPVPDALRHSWQRPSPVFPGLDEWGTGFLTLASGQVDFGSEPGADASSSSIAAAGSHTVLVTATAGTKGCEIGDVGVYDWSLDGQATVVTLTSVSPDACPAREDALAGPWVRSDLPPPKDPGATLPAGTYQTSAFDPFGGPGLAGRLSYTVPEGWKVKEDQPSSFLLHRLGDASPSPSTDSMIAFIVQPGLAADSLPDGAPCGPFSDAPGVGHSVEDLVAAITARPGVVSTRPLPVKVGGYSGQMLDLHLAPVWTRGCQAPDGPFVGVPILLQSGSGTGPAIGISRDHPVRLILLDLTQGRTMAITIFDPEPSTSAQFDEKIAVAMPVVESFEFSAPSP